MSGAGRTSLGGLTTAPAPPPPIERALQGRRVRAAVLALSALLLAGVVVVRAYLAKVGSLPGDHYVAVRLPNPLVPQPIEQLGEFFATLAYPLVAMLTVAVAAWLVHRTLGARRGVGVLLASAAVVANSTLKVVFGPTQLYADTVGHSDVANYPSGHVTYATALFGYLGYLSLERRRPEGAMVAVLLIALMGVARLITGAHFPSDVLGGYLLGAGWLLGVILWTTRR